jgi:mitogen-activated protein kinase kinase kinase 11
VYLVEELCACSLDAVAVLPYGGGHQHAAAVGAGAGADDDDHQQQQRRRRPQLTSLQRVTVLRQVATAMQYSHSKGIAHRDLKLANILLDRDNTAKLCDFGIARHVTARQSSSNNVSMTGGVGTPEYTAPELISTCAHGRAEGGLAMDVYAFGMVLWALQARCVPWRHDPAQCLTRWQIETKVVAGERPPMPAATPPAMVALIRQCWAQRPEDRPEFGTVCAALEIIEAQVHQAQLAGAGTGAGTSAAAASPTPKDELPEALAKVCSESVDP